ncbi:MAG: ATP-binding cassette domain-containing protein [Planctomycetota bacterium]|jgi:ABC-type branched-subunit amino acid transport system ATPase component|nr:ATP-binding cassette domain-containing protein [Planctomycetota bacterium]
MLLEVEHLDVFYGKAQAVHSAAIGVKPGEMAFLVGRNGAGKTTIMRAISGFTRAGADSRIHFNGVDIANHRPEEIARSGLRYVFQDKRVITKLTVRENIHLAAYPFHVSPKAAVAKICDIYPRIEKFLNIKAGGLSGGQRQLLLIGRALIGNPKLLLIDEPTEGLAAGIIEDVFKVLSQLKGDVSMLIVEQNLDLVRRLADRIYAMKEGRIMMELDNSADSRSGSNLEQFL